VLFVVQVLSIFNNYWQKHIISGICSQALQVYRLLFHYC